MQNRPSPRGSNVPAVIDQRSSALGSVNERRTSGQSHHNADHAHDADATFEEPDVETIIDPSQIKEKIIDYLGAVLARCWFDHDLLNNIAKDAHSALRQVGIVLPREIDIKVERENKSRPRLVIYEYNATRTFRKRICYLQLVMMAGA